MCNFLSSLEEKKVGMRTALFVFAMPDAARCFITTFVMADRGLRMALKPIVSHACIALRGSVSTHLLRVFTRNFLWGSALCVQEERSTVEIGSGITWNDPFER